jgi:hypothetical protein
MKYSPLMFVDRMKRELDVAVVVEETLLLCECKAAARRPKDDVPTHGHVLTWWERLDEAVDQVETLAEKLASTALQRPRALPPRVRNIVHCVVTPGPEWIPIR